LSSKFLRESPFPSIAPGVKPIRCLFPRPQDLFYDSLFPPLVVVCSSFFLPFVVLSIPRFIVTAFYSLKLFFYSPLWRWTPVLLERQCKTWRSLQTQSSSPRPPSGMCLFSFSLSCFAFFFIPSFFFFCDLYSRPSGRGKMVEFLRFLRLSKKPA